MKKGEKVQKKSMSNKTDEILMFVSKKVPNNAVRSQSSIVLIVLVDDWKMTSTIKYCLPYFWRQTSKSHENQAPYYFCGRCSCYNSCEHQSDLFTGCVLECLHAKCFNGSRTSSIQQAKLMNHICINCYNMYRWLLLMV